MNIVSVSSRFFFGCGPWTRTICISTFWLVLVGCASGSGVRYKRLLDEAGYDIGFVCVVPMYKKGGGVGLGPDAVGSKVFPDSYLVAPFKIDSGNNMLSGVVKNERMLIPIPPFISFGETLTYDRFLLLKKGYKPVLLLQHDLFLSDPVILSKSYAGEATEKIRAILETPPQQAVLQAIFETQSYVHVEYSDADAALLRSCAR